MYDNYDELDDDVAYYDDLLDEIEEEREELRSTYQTDLDEIDEYWDRENQYIKDRGIYTEEEVQTILAHHNRIRDSKKKEIEEQYEAEKELLESEREIAMLDRENALYDRKEERLLREKERNSYSHRVQTQQYQYNQKQPSFIKRLMILGGANILFKKLFSKK